MVLAGLLPELLLVAALLLPPNRRLRAWWIWAPFGVVLLERSLLLSFLGDSSGADAADIFSWSIETLGCGLALLWLFGHRFRSRPFVSSLILALAILLAPALAGWVFQTGYYSRSLTLGLGAVYGLAVLTYLAAFCYSAFHRRRPPTGGRLAMRFFFGCLLGGFFLTLATGFLVTTIQDQWKNVDWTTVFSQSAIGGLVLGLVLFLLAAPFLVLSYRNGFYRDRFRSVFVWETAPDFIQDGGDAPVSEPGEVKLPPSLPQPTKESAG